jgi:hypothetical protein
MTISVTVSNIEAMTAVDIARLAQMLLSHNGHASPMVAGPMVANPPTPAADPVAQPLPVISFPEVPAPVANNPFAERGEYQSPSLAVHQSKTPFAKTEELQINHAAAGDLREPAELQQAPGIDVDKAGLPWDGRIHASTRAKNADGTWRMRRGIEEALVAAVTGELRQTMAPVIPQPPAQAVPAIPKPPFVPSVVPPVPQASITPETALVGAVLTASHSDVPALTFPKLMQLITTAFTSKALSQEQIKAAIEAAGLPSLPMLASRPDLVQGVADSLGLRA